MSIWLNLNHVVLRNLNIWLLLSDSGGSLNKWLDREFWRPGNGSGKERDRESRGWAGWGRVGGRVGSKPQICDVILFKVCAERGGWDGMGGWGAKEKAGCDGHPGWRPWRPAPGGDVLVRGSSSDPDSSLDLSRSPLVFISSSLRSGLEGPSISSSESESESWGSEDLRSGPPRPDLSSPYAP